MTILWQHLKVMALDLLRQPAYVIPTFVFPAAFYWFFGIPEAVNEGIANTLIGSFSAFAVFGVVFLQFGVGIAEERHSAWSLYLRSLPLNPAVFLSARFLCALIFSVLAAGVVILVGCFESPVNLSLTDWSRFLFSLLAGSLPFAFMGMTLGYLTGPKSSLPLANLIYLPLSFVGGLWKPPQLIPESLHDISKILPSRHYGEVIWAACLSKEWQAENWLWLGGFTFVFAVTTWLVYRRDQSLRFA